MTRASGAGDGGESTSTSSTVRGVVQANSISRRWPEVFAAFRWDPATAPDAVGCSWEQLVESLLKSFAIERDAAMRLQMLAFLEEYAVELLTAAGVDPVLSLSRVARQLNSILTAPVDGSVITYSLKGQVLVTTTTLLIELEAIKVDQGLLESFVELLYQVIQHVNNSADRELRGTACECLRELEWHYPCLLHAGLGHLFNLAQAERTHVAGAYAVLLATVLQHAAASPPAPTLPRPQPLLSAALPLRPFKLPLCVTQLPIDDALRAARESAGDKLAKELSPDGDAVGFLRSCASLLTTIGTLELARMLDSLAEQLHFPVSFFELFYFGFLTTYNPSLCHALVLLVVKNPCAFHSKHSAVLRRAVYMVNDGHQSNAHRLLALSWAQALDRAAALQAQPPTTEASPGSASQSPRLAPLWPSLVPSAFDPFELQVAKTGALIGCAAPTPDAAQGPAQERAGDSLAAESVSQHALTLEAGVVAAVAGLDAFHATRADAAQVASLPNKQPPISLPCHSEFLHQVIERFPMRASPPGSTSGDNRDGPSNGDGQEGWEGDAAAVATRASLGPGARAATHVLFCLVESQARGLPQLAHRRLIELLFAWPEAYVQCALGLLTRLRHSSRARGGTTPLLGALRDALLSAVRRQPSTSWLEREPAQHIKPYPIPTTFQFLTYLPVIQHIVADPQISPIPLLKALASAIQQRWSSNTSPGDSVGTASAAGAVVANDDGSASTTFDSDPCISDTWLEGMNIFHIIRISIQVHPLHELVALLAQLLQAMADFSRDPDIRDQASRYARMLTRVPMPQLRQLLSEGGEEPEIAPRRTHRARPSPSSVTCVPQEALATQLILRRIPRGQIDAISSGREPLPLYIAPELCDPASSESRSLLRRHMQALDARAVTFASPMKISLGCTLSFASGEPDNAEKFQQLPYKLYGGVLTFRVLSSPDPNWADKLTQPYYCHVRSVLVPCLQRDSRRRPDSSVDCDPPLRQEDATTSLEACAYVSVEVQAQVPFPVPLDVQMEFSDSEGGSWTGSLGTLNVHLEDFFLPVPILDLDFAGGTQIAYASALFDPLWALLTQSSESNRTSDCRIHNSRSEKGFCEIPIIDWDIVEGSESVKQLLWSSERMMHTLAAHLGDFMVQCCSKAKGQCVKTALNAPDCQPKEGSTATDEEICFMMFLPPRYHLLLRANISSKSTLVRIATDYWPIMMHIDEYLEGLVEMEACND